MNDNIKHPNHYCKNGMECIDAIKAVVSTITDPFEAYCTGNIIKYIWRWHDKNGVEDLRKAVQYIDFIEKHRTGKPTATENDEGKYAEWDNAKLHIELCNRFEDCDTDGRCPLYNGVPSSLENCYKFIVEHPAEFRKIAIEYLEGLDKQN